VDNAYGATILWTSACVDPTNHARTLHVGWTFHTMLEESGAHALRRTIV